VAGEVERGGEGEVDVAVQDGRGGLGGDELGDFGRERRGDGVGRVRVGVLAGEGAGDVARVGAEVEDEGEVALDVLA